MSLSSWQTARQPPFWFAHPGRDGDSRIFFFFFWSEERRMEERRAGSIPPFAVKTCLYKHWHWEDKWPESIPWLPPPVWNEGGSGLQQVGLHRVCPLGRTLSLRLVQANWTRLSEVHEKWNNDSSLVCRLYPTPLNLKWKARDVSEVKTFRFNSMDLTKVWVESTYVRW